MDRRPKQPAPWAAPTPIEAHVQSGMVVVKGPQGLHLQLTPSSAEHTAAMLWDAATKARQVN
jgi:hypothetical protein